MTGDPKAVRAPSPCTNMKPVSKRKLIEQLVNLGVRPGAVLLVHASFSRLGPVEDGPDGLIEALRKTLGPKGTLIMPSMSSDGDQVFDPASTPCREMGVVADTFWRRPGVLRSDSPHAFAAAGLYAKKITAPHPIDPPHGSESPVGRAYELDARILLLGLGHEADTTIHLAENLAGVCYRRLQHVTVLKDGKPSRFEYTEIDHCCAKFALVDEWLQEKRLQRSGIVGHGMAKLARSREIVYTVLSRLRENETVFLHPPGTDTECDEAWQGIMARSAIANR